MGSQLSQLILTKYNLTHETFFLLRQLPISSSEVTDEVYIIQNTKNKNAKGAFLDLEFFQELLSYKEAMDEGLDYVMEQEVIARKDHPANLSLSEVFEEDDIDFDSLTKELGEDK